MSPTGLPAPMLATPSDSLPVDGDNWAYEMKWDGYRAIVEAADGRIRIVSRRGNDVTAKYPELAGLAQEFGLQAVLDGELVVLDDAGRPSFQAIQQHEAPVVYLIFDLLQLDNRDLMTMPWEHRRSLLDQSGLEGERWQVSPVVVGDAHRMESTARELGMEGVVAKRVDSPYRPGRRTREWVKYRFVLRQELVIGGWFAGEGRLHGTIGSLLVGYHDGAGGLLHYCGRVGSGLDDARRADLTRRFTPRPDSPFVNPPRERGITWVEPELVAEVRFTEWTTDGVLRQPVLLGLRDDKDPKDVIRET